jgi:hypothetical protein
MKVRQIVPAALVLLVAGTAGAQAPQKLTGFAAWSKVMGNTVSAKVDGKDMVEFYTSEGVAKHLEGGSKISTGKWVLEGANVCFTYPGDEKACYVIEVTDDIATYTSKTHGGFRATIIPGNPNKL